MPVVKGDRIGESQRLNRRSVEAQDFYAHLVTSKIPDDFLRFRLQPSLIVSTMYPRREPTLGLIQRVRRLLAELASNPDPLWRTWEVDGVQFAELTTGQPRGNRYHRTPEPPWTAHEHSGACASTAIHRAREWGNHTEAARLSLFLKEIRDRKTTGRGTEAAPGGAPEGNHPSVPSVPSVPMNNNDPPTPPSAEGGSRSGQSSLPRATGNGHGTALKGEALHGAVLGLVAHWRYLGRFDRTAATGWAEDPATVPQESNVRHWSRALRRGRLTVDELRKGITNRVFAELLRMGKVNGDEPWPPSDEPPKES